MRFAISTIALVSGLALSPAAAAPPPAATIVTPQTYARAETDRSFYNVQQQAGGINKFFKIRKPTPLDQQTVVRMNKDTLYSAAIVDTSKGATITIPKMPPGRYFSVELVDNDHYAPAVIYTPGVHKLPTDTRYLATLVRIQLLKPDDPADVALVNKLQDQFIITAGSAVPMQKPKWDKASLEKLTAHYNREYAKYDKNPDGWMAARGVADDKTRQIYVAAGWGGLPNKDAAYLNYTPKLPASGCYTATYKPPENAAFWSITVYGADGYMKSSNNILNMANRKAAADGNVKVFFGSRAACGDVPNRLDISEGWNFTMRVYRPGKSVRDGSYVLPAVKPVSR